MFRPLGAAGMILVGVLATVLFVVVDATSSVFGVIGVLLLTLLVAFSVFASLRLLLTKPAGKPFEDRPGPEARRPWGLGPFWVWGHTDVAPTAFRADRRVWRWSRADSPGRKAE